jgi:predicted esterase YcpF (UPF0227 family)
MKILYFHGLESALPSSKADWMAEQGHTIVSHPMQYEQKNSYDLALKYARAFKPNMIVGSSMGGYFLIQSGSSFMLSVSLASLKASWMASFVSLSSIPFCTFSILALMT